MYCISTPKGPSKPSDAQANLDAGKLSPDNPPLGQFTYETHLHTSEGSRCGHSSGVEMARYFKARGYTGIFVTDHFFNGNTTVPDDLPWQERVQLFCEGYQAAAREGQQIGLDVFFGWEYSYGWAHLITYGLDQAWLLAHPDLLEWPVLEYLERVRAEGGVVVHAHPFREGVDLVRLFPNHVDAIEVINGNREAKHNRHALDYARSFNLPQTAGSDIHSVQQTRLCGLHCQRRLTGGGRDYLDAILSGDATKFDVTRRQAVRPAGDKKGLV